MVAPAGLVAERSLLLAAVAQRGYLRGDQRGMKGSRKGPGQLFIRSPVQRARNVPASPTCTILSLPARPLWLELRVVAEQVGVFCAREGPGGWAPPENRGLLSSRMMAPWMPAHQL